MPVVEDFTRAFNAVFNNSLDDDIDSIAEPNPASHGANVEGQMAVNMMRELDKMLRIMADPPPDAPAADLHKVCTLSIKASKQHWLTLGTGQHSACLYTDTTGP